MESLFFQYSHCLPSYWVIVLLGNSTGSVSLACLATMVNLIWLYNIYSFTCINKWLQIFTMYHANVGFAFNKFVVVIMIINQIYLFFCRFSICIYCLFLFIFYELAITLSGKLKVPGNSAGDFLRVYHTAEVTDADDVFRV